MTDDKVGSDAWYSRGEEQGFRRKQGKRSIMSNSWFQLVRSLTETLVHFPSVTQTANEVLFAEHLYTTLSDHPYFQAHPTHIWLEPIADDLYHRSIVYALVKGDSPETVVLSGHYDVVNVENYGPLAPWAYEPQALIQRLIEDLKTNTGSSADLLALHDLQSGDYLPGRGALDMKSGLAAGIAVLYRWAETHALRGNLLFVATPDEEATSCGMRAAVQRLPSLMEQWDLDLIAAINLDSESDPGDGSDGRAVFLGSVGKLLPSVYIIGRDTHAGAPFDGISAALIAAAITQRIECNTVLVDRVAGEAPPPPVCLQQIDLKHGYDVTTPRTAWCLYNVLTHGSSPTQVIERMRREVQQAIDDTVLHMQTQAARYSTLAGRAITTPAWQPLTLTFAELKERALEHGGSSATESLTELTERLRGDTVLNLTQMSLRITELLWSFSGLTGPAVVIGLAGLYYPPVHLYDKTSRHQRLREIVARQAATLGQEKGCSIRLRPFFPGISDMSFFGPAGSSDDVAAISRNTPTWGSRIVFDYHVGEVLNVPVINIGPWGRDYHQRMERVNMPYSFAVVPELIWRVVHDLVG